MDNRQIFEKITTDKTLTEMAIELARRGVSVIATDAAKKPARVNGKMLEWELFKQRIATEDELQAMFKENAQGIATIGGEVSGGLETLDFDYHHPYAGIGGSFFGNVYPAWSEIVKAQRPDLFQRLVINNTPNGGHHARYRYKAESYEGKKSLAQAYNQDAEGKILLEHGKPKIVEIIEQRGEGAYALCPPSPGYQMIQGDILDIPTITKAERDFLIQIAKSFHAIPNDVKAKNQMQPTDDILRPGDDFNQRGDHRAFLEKHGWTFVTERKDGAELWRRPGKEGNGYSATWNAIPNRFYVFSTNASPLEGERTYDKFSLYAYLEHNADFGAAAKALAAQGYGTQKQAFQVGAQEQPSTEGTQTQLKDNKVRDEKRTHHLLFLAKRYHQQKKRRKEILALLQKENEAKCEPCLSETEIDAILDKILPRLQTITAAKLLEMDIPEPKWAIPDFVPEGLTILAGRPKVGKSWLALSLGAAVAMGGYALGKIQVEQGEALYIGLEDNYRRLQDRLFQLCEGVKPTNLHILLDLPKLDHGGLDVLGDWLDEHPHVRLIVIDTLQRVKPSKRKTTTDLYSEDYDFTGTLQRFALTRGIALICVHHTRKAEADYLIDELSGTTGISAGADCILMLKQRLDGHILYRTGRDVEEGEFAVRRDNNIGWELLGDAKEFAISEQRRAIIEILQEAGKSLGSKEIADLLQKNYSTVRWMLAQMAKDGQIEKSGSKYNAIITNTPNSANTPNTPNNANTSSSVGVLEPDANTPNTSETSHSVAPSDSVCDVCGVGGVDTEQQPQISEKVDDDISSCSPEHNGKLSKQLNEYLADCSDKWINLIHDGLKTAKIPLSKATEASRRMSNGDSQGAWRLIRQNGG